MKLLEITGNRTQTAQNSNVKLNVNSLGLFQNWLLSEISSQQQPGDEAKTSDAKLNEALSKIGDWLKAGPEDQELQLKQLLEAVKALEGKQTTETALPLLKQLAESVQDMLAGKRHGVKPEKNEPNSSAKDENSARDALETGLLFIQEAVARLFTHQEELPDSAQAKAVYQEGTRLLDALKKQGVPDRVIQDLRQTLFPKNESASKLYSMSAAELKSFQSVTEQLAGLSQKGTKEWNMAETELKAFVLSQSSESSQESAGKTDQQNGGTVSHVKAPDSKLSAHILFSGTRSIAGIQQASAGAEQQPAENKPLTEQVISGWKQMKYTPFGKTTGSFTIRLNPENLGFVTIKVTNENGMFQSKIIASSQSAKELLEQHLPQLKQSLPNMSVQIDRFTVPLQSGDQQPVYGQTADHNKQQHLGQREQKNQQQSGDFGDMLEELSLNEMEEE
ncbi:flagellar hook-length control protein [Bacillus amyloliquefaciens]|uniref:Flagellar hook-length control protein n=1 Tax=Bacillus amyloliquefaciens (strain ATCC 23350 / DSM 7 / BCRC 11601 / CCUG 28519 / NBRC 15535 / NRRL B-14393 / F) TaxID=692420 RepID=A0A9P1JGY8_BACAS|nr:flagellar hook-length control protein FliK [Bacillus amyloliquefaciens]AZV89153.1 flagellar hook-length control protein [Bacillus amyloliquefaciens]MDR4377019.1 flagellar hook-length control protein FliK [Bacillus amyloliquefaciens]MEC1838860.1 flagellar hook-length control protein FliK [Bacillus amyloliquefaciens]MEC1846019.1 flagellar hook-length control protein FliK [Bacillus amyloliquefaciens]MEC1930766.1 flagellar hook-length control protein FliK [Bacillus amyloliquefaciens]